MTKNQEIIYGLHVVRHALEQEPATILAVWIQRGKESIAVVDEIIHLSAKQSIHVEYLPKSTLDKHSDHGVHQGVILIKKTDKAGLLDDIDEILRKDNARGGLFLVLDGVQDPQNLGACIRTANAAAVDAVIITRDRAASITPVVRKVASGAVGHTPVLAVANLARTLRKLKESGIWIIGMDNQADQSIYDMDLTMPLALVMGAEGQGIRQNTRKHCDFLVHLPMLGIVESLNVSVASAICLYEVIRQRGKMQI